MKLGLIAMSGVRAQNPELNRLGLTLPGFVERNRVIASLPSLSLLTLAGMTSPEIEVAYHEVPDLTQMGDLPGAFDVVAIASYSAQIKDAYRLAERYRRAGSKVILGGLHVSARPEEAGQYADSVVIGEAEPVWPQVLADLKAQRLQAIYNAPRTQFDLRKAPMPRFELLDPERYNRITVQTQRGCPLSCEFCASSIRIAPKFTTKPVDKVIAEIRRIKSIWPQPFIEFADDNTFANKAHGKRLVKELEKEGIRWFTETDISVAEDDELLAMLADSGCSQLLIGLEAPDTESLEGLETKTNWKAKRADCYLEAIEKIQRHGITVNGCFILGLDGQGTGAFDAVRNFVRQSALYEVQVTLQTPFPGTPLHERLQREGRLLTKDDWDRCTLFDLMYEPSGMSAEELETGFKGLVEDLYSNDFTQWRRGQFRRSSTGKRIS